MTLIDHDSLARTVENVTHARCHEETFSDRDKGNITDFLFSRHTCNEYRYAGMFAPTKSDFTGDVKLYTGEKLTTQASKAHILSEEAGRILLQFNADDESFMRTYNEIISGMLNRLNDDENQYATLGFYCCGTCSVSMWRHLIAGGLDRGCERLADGLDKLKRYRDGKGRYKRFPFWYTMLALSDILENETVQDEITDYARPSLQRTANRKAGNLYAERRKGLARFILNSIPG